MSGVAKFDDTVQDTLTCGSVEVGDIAISSPEHGLINKMSRLTTGGFDQGALDELMGCLQTDCQVGVPQGLHKRLHVGFGEIDDGLRLNPPAYAGRLASHWRLH